jgi:hypothetical protein
MPPFLGLPPEKGNFLPQVTTPEMCNFQMMYYDFRKAIIEKNKMIFQTTFSINNDSFHLLKCVISQRSIFQNRKKYF